MGILEYVHSPVGYKAETTFWKEENGMQEFELIFQKGQHISRLLTGFYLLECAGKVRCRYTDNASRVVNLPESTIVEAHVEGKRIAFDMGDRMALNHADGLEYLSRVDAYFARSYDENLVGEIPQRQAIKVKPFGFDYYMTYHGNPADSSPIGVKEKLRQLIRDISGYSRCMHVDAFEREPDYKEKDLRIIFMTRLWDPSDIKLNDNTPEEWRPYRQYMIEERNKINHDRIEIVRQLKKIYGDDFSGGIQYSPFAEMVCPDILVPKELTRKKAYLNKMQNADICIGSMGLHKSIGWKTGEYIAASRAIVAERFCYQVPGSYTGGKHYIPFDDVEGCLSAVEQLYHDPEAVFAMKKANHEYYWQYLRPEKQIMNALNQCI